MEANDTLRIDDVYNGVDYNAPLLPPSLELADELQTVFVHQRQSFKANGMRSVYSWRAVFRPACHNNYVVNGFYRKYRMCHLRGWPTLVKSLPKFSGPAEVFKARFLMHNLCNHASTTHPSYKYFDTIAHQPRRGLCPCLPSKHMGHCLKRSLKLKEQQKKPWPVQ
eukprot:1153450-Pelagomonas_calceolata.AAC.5